MKKWIFSIICMFLVLPIMVSAKTFTITFNPNGGTVGQKTMVVDDESTYGTLPKATRKGYDFCGWYTGKTEGDKISSDTLVNPNVKTFYARWGRHKYTINYVLNSGTNNSANPSKYMITDEVILKNPTRKGAVFLGWYKESTFKTKVTTIKKGTTGNKTFYARWAAAKYSVTYVANGGTGTMAKSTGFKYGKEYTLRANTFKRKGFKFVSWNTKKDGSGTSYANQAKVKNLTYKNGANVNLYARWNRVKYKITYDLRGGTNNKANPSTYTIIDTVSLKTPTRKGCTFKGWYTDSKFKNKVTSIPKGSTGNKTLYAKWGKTQYNITYKLNEGTFYYYGEKNVPYKYNYFDGIEWTPDPYREGYTFVGWYLNSNFDGARLNYIYEMTGDITLYARWTNASGRDLALIAAIEILKDQPWSYEGLAEELREGAMIAVSGEFSEEDILYALENCGADWNEQAALFAKDYMETDWDVEKTYSALVEYLEDVGFTPEQAVYGANNCGYTWD